MRLSLLEKETIIHAILEVDNSAQIYLFGSRVNDAARGGDIDILIISGKIGLVEIIKIKSRIFKTLPEQKIDMVIKQPSAMFDDAFIASVNKEPLVLQ